MDDRQKNKSRDSTTGKTCLTLFPDVPPDHKHCLAINCLSFTMEMLLPTRHILFKQNKHEMFEKCRAQFDKLHLDTSSFDVLFYGLNFEELSYPTLLPKPDAGQRAIMPPGKEYESIWVNDGFSLICPKEWQVVLEEDDFCNVKLQLVVDENGLREDGNFKLRIAGTNDFLSSQLQTNYLKWMRNKLGESTHENDTSTLANLPDAEHTIFGYKCVSWPTKFTTATWSQGATLHGWPSQEIIGRITSVGCHVVPCPDKIDSCKWKFSFVEAEHILTSVLTLSQRQCFIFLEILIDRWFRSRDVLTPVHLKHLFFNLCEKMDPEKWGQEDGLAFASLTLINDINYALDQENIPNYFIPELNMLQNADKGSIRRLKEDINTFRKAPLQNLFSLFDRYRFKFSPLLVPIGDVFDDISQIFENCAKDPTKVRRVFLQTSLKFAAFHFVEDRIEEGIAHSYSARELVETYFGMEMSIAKYIFKQTSVMGPEVATKVYETFLKGNSDDEEGTFATAKLACMYHACIYEHEEGTAQYQGYIQKTEETFQKALAMPLASCGAKCDYALFLIKFKKTAKASDILEDVIKSEADSPSSKNLYGKAIIKTVDENLANEIKANNELAIRSLVLALYISIKLEEQRGDVQSTKLGRLLNVFENVCWAIDEVQSDPEDKDPVMFSLLGYSFMTIKNYEKAKECFLKALEIKPDYGLAKENRDLCEAMYHSMQCDTQ